MAFLKRFFSGFVCSRVWGALRCYRRVFYSWRAGWRIGRRGWRIRVFEGVGFLEFFAFSVKRSFQGSKKNVN